MVVYRLSNIYCCWVCDAQLTYASPARLLAFAVLALYPLALFISLGRLIGTYNQFLLYPAIKSVTFVSAYALAFLRNCKHALLHPSPIPLPKVDHAVVRNFHTLLPSL